MRSTTYALPLACMGSSRGNAPLQIHAMTVLSQLRFERPYVVFDVHHVLDRLTLYQSLCLAEWLLHCHIDWGICSCGVGKRMNQWLVAANMRPMIEDARFVIVNKRHVYDRWPGNGKEYSNKWIEWSYDHEWLPWLPDVAVAVDGHKGDVARLLPGPSILFDDRLENCMEWCRMGDKDNQARLVSRSASFFDNREPVYDKLFPPDPTELMLPPHRITDELPVFAAEKRSKWYLQILEFVQRLENHDAG